MAPESSSARFRVSAVTVTMKLRFVTPSANASMAGFTVTVTPLGASTLATYTDLFGHPKLQLMSR
jgi:hypothetical protein